MILLKKLPQCWSSMINHALCEPIFATYIQALSLKTKPQLPKVHILQELFEQGKKAIESKQYNVALPLLKKAANQGHIEAQYDLGIIYRNGKGVSSHLTQEKRYARAINWFQKSSRARSYRCAI